MTSIRSCVLIAALVAATSLPAPAWYGRRPGPLPEESRMTDQETETARLTAMCGVWDVAMTLWVKPGAAGLTTKATSTITPLFGGRYIEETIEGTFNGVPFTTKSWTGFNAATRQYEATRISSTSPGRIAETGHFDELAKAFDLKADYQDAGDTWHQRTTILPQSADSMVATSYLSFGRVPEWKAVEIKYTRRP